jgi:dihydrofolate synthase / folylpolyglutamate synthase
MQTLAEWLEWQERLHPRAMDFTLERLARVLARLPIAPPRGAVLVVGGTNGKGSVTAFLDAFLAAGGRRVGLYTSPHLERYTERIRIAGAEIDEATLIRSFEAIERVRGGETLTFFEYGTAAAFLAFSEAKLDAWVLEVGLGGRLDAVNLVDADCAVIVSVALDHTELLGPDRESIGREKAGILRAGRPAVFGSRDPPRSVEAQAAALGARLYLQGRDYAAQASPAGGFSYRGPSLSLESLPAPALAGAVQSDNAATALVALELLSLLPARAGIERALREVRLPARFERIATPDGLEWRLDVAHNPDAARVLALNLAHERWPGRTIAVYGALRDKDAAGVGAELKGRFDAWIAVTLAGERGLPAAALAERAGLGRPLALAGSVPEALSLARAAARAGDRIVVFGSFVGVGPAREWLRLYSGR